VIWSSQPRPPGSGCSRTAAAAAATARAIAMWPACCSRVAWQRCWWIFW